MCAITGNRVSYATLLYGAFFCISSTIHAENVPISSRKKDEKPFFSVELVIPKKKNTFFVGEIFTGTIRCIYDPQSYSVNMIAPPTNAEIVVLSLSEARTETITVNDIACVMHEWLGTFYAKKSGSYECGPFQVKGEQKAAHTSHNFFRMMWSSSFTGYSNTVMMHVVDVPACVSNDMPKIGFFPVGDFEKVHITLERFTMKKGDAQTLYYTIEGEGNGVLLDHPALQLPPGIKYYVAQKKQESETRYVFEYVIQATEEGIITLPTQELIYFNPATYEHRSLKTIPMRLHIEQGWTVQADTQEIADTVAPQDLYTEGECADQEKKEHDDHLSWLRTVEIPANIFVGMIIVLLMLILYFCFCHWVYSLGRAFKERRKYRDLLKKARKGYTIYEKNGDVIMMYESFKDLSEMYPPRSESWDDFFDQLKLDYFCQKMLGSDALRELNTTIGLQNYSKKVYVWIHYFEKKLWRKR